MTVLTYLTAGHLNAGCNYMLELKAHGFSLALAENELSEYFCV
jgi:hypothetical protein